MTIESAATDSVREQAATWLIQLEDNSSTEQQQAFQHWLNSDSRHKRIFEQMERLWTGVCPPPQTRKRNSALGVASVFLLAALLAMQLPWQFWRADYNTAVGQITTITLPDGSTATLDTNSAIDIEFTRNQRRIILISGEVLVDVHKDPERPLIVSTPSATAKALGTRYSVRRGDDHSLVTVYESRVWVSTIDQQSAVVVDAGQQVRVHDNSIEIQNTTANGNLPAYPDWSRQRLVFQDAPLSDVVERLNHYHQGFIKLNSDAQQRRFTGVLPANDAHAALEVLASSMELDIHQFSPYIAYLTPRAEP